MPMITDYWLLYFETKYKITIWGIWFLAAQISSKNISSLNVSTHLYNWRIAEVINEQSKTKRIKIHHVKETTLGGKKIKIPTKYFKNNYFSNA